MNTYLFICTICFLIFFVIVENAETELNPLKA